MSLTVQIFHQGRWHDAATLEMPSPERGRHGPAYLGYGQDYALAWMFHDDEHACSLTLPVELMTRHAAPRWFGFVEDIMPAGASRRFWVTQLGLEGRPEAEQDYALLSHGTIAPVGNLRIKEAVPERPPGSRLERLRFALDEVVERDSDFLAYAQQMGAASGGATGAGGEAPKLLVRCTPHDEVWIDTWQDDPKTLDAHYLVKFPRGRRSQDDCDVLRGEYHYYQELAALGIETIETRRMRLIEGSRYPSLWLPRFDVDVDVDDGALVRHGLESVSSLLGVGPGTLLEQGETLRGLVRLLASQHRVVEGSEAFDSAAFAIEWVRRDLLNVAFGNSDNHGRNTALIKRQSGIRLAPVFDFAPMKADPEGVTRSMRWGSPYEEGGEFDWPAIAESLGGLVEPDRLMAELEALASRLLGLRERLQAKGMPPRLLDMPTLGLVYLDDKLKRWGLA